MDGRVIRSHILVEAVLETNRKAGILSKEQLAIRERDKSIFLGRQWSDQQNSQEVWLNPLEQPDNQAGEEARSAINYGCCVQTDQAIHSHTNETIRNRSSSQKDGLFLAQNDRKKEAIEGSKRQYPSQSVYRAHKSQAKNSTFSCIARTDIGAHQMVHWQNQAISHNACNAHDSALARHYNH